MYSVLYKLKNGCVCTTIAQQQGIIDACTPNIFLKYIIPLLKTVLINIIVS